MMQADHKAVLLDPSPRQLTSDACGLLKLYKVSDRLLPNPMTCGKEKNEKARLCPKDGSVPLHPTI